MKCVTVLQPWAHAIFDPILDKWVENRSWSTSFRGWLLIHAGLSRRLIEGPDAFTSYWGGGPAVPAEKELTFGAIVGVAHVVDWLGWKQLPEHLQASGWVQGPQCLVMRERMKLRRPIPMRGQQGMYEVTMTPELEALLPITAEAMEEKYQEACAERERNGGRMPGLTVRSDQRQAVMEMGSAPGAARGRDAQPLIRG